LKHLYRIEANKSEDANRLSIKFYFTENEWFTNGCILKEFLLEDDEVEKTHGDAIDWKAGKNVTVKAIKKKQKNKKTGEKKVALKEIK
jgi:nucleosome assembly protein 1-like 1